MVCRSALATTEFRYGATPGRMVRAATSRKSFSRVFPLTALRASTTSHRCSTVSSSASKRPHSGVRAIVTIRRRMIAISQAHQEHGFEPPTADKVVREVLADIARTNGSAQRKKSALTVDLLRAARCSRSTRQRSRASATARCCCWASPARYAAASCRARRRAPGAFDGREPLPSRCRARRQIKKAPVAMSRFPAYDPTGVRGRSAAGLTPRRSARPRLSHLWPAARPPCCERQRASAAHRRARHRAHSAALDSARISRHVHRKSQGENRTHSACVPGDDSTCVARWRDSTAGVLVLEIVASSRPRTLRFSVTPT
jgi:hypothetical protein